MKMIGYGRMLLLAMFAGFLFGGSAVAGDVPKLNSLADAKVVFPVSDSVTVKGDVLQVFDWQYSKIDQSPSYAVVLKMLCDGEEVLVYMGPKQFLSNRGYEFAPTEKLDIEGVLANIEGQVMLLARSYTSAGTTFAIRRMNGSMAVR